MAIIRGVWRPIAAKELQAGSLRYYKELVRFCSVTYRMYHVHGHLDQFLTFEQMTSAE
jgi:hypothetical protein